MYGLRGAFQVFVSLLPFRVLSRLALLTMWVAMFWAASALANDGVGLSEEFQSTEGWKYQKDSFRKVKIVDGRLVLSTWVGSFTGTKPPDQEKSFPGTSSLVKQFDQEVDLDKFHFIVMKIAEKPMFSILP